MTDQLKLPDLSGLPEGPWKLDGSNVLDADFDVIASCGFQDGTANARRQNILVARAIAAIPAMVAEIGELREESSRSLTDNMKLSKLLIDRDIEIENLRALIAEMIVAYDAVGLEGHPALVHEACLTKEKARAILAKSEAASC